MCKYLSIDEILAAELWYKDCQTVVEILREEDETRTAYTEDREV